MRPFWQSIRWIVYFGLLTVAAGRGGDAPVASEEGVALAIVLDTSGSMQEEVPDRDGRPARKYLIANRALQAVVDRLERFVKGGAPGTVRKLRAGLIVFQGGQPREAIEFGDFAPERFRRWAAEFRKPEGATPLGDSLRLAGQRVLGSTLSRKHVLVVTDGMNTAGPDPARVLPDLRRQAQQKQTTLGVHFIAFDVDAGVFAPVKRLGATVVGAIDERQLQSRLQTILEEKILLEDEEPPGAGNRKQPSPAK